MEDMVIDWTKYMKILITGNMGYVGSSLTRYLRLNYPHYTIYGLDLGFFGANLTNSTCLPETACNLQIYEDVRATSDEILRSVDAIVHLAAVSNDPIGNEFTAATSDINETATVRLAARAAKQGVKRFIFASSCSVYGAGSETPRTELDGTDPLTAYAKSKIAAERALMSLDSSDMQVTCLRFATACGMSPRLRLDLVLNDFVASAIVHQRIDILSDGTPWRPLIDVTDMARAIDWAAHRESVHGGSRLIVNVGKNDANYRVIELATEIKSLFPEVSVKIQSQMSKDLRSYKVDFNLFKKLAPDHQPNTPLHGSILGLETGLRELGFKDTSFRSSQLVRLNVLRQLMRAGKLDSMLRVISH